MKKVSPLFSGTLQVRHGFLMDVHSRITRAGGQVLKVENLDNFDNLKLQVKEIPAKLVKQFDRECRTFEGNFSIANYLERVQAYEAYQLQRRRKRDLKKVKNWSE